MASFFSQSEVRAQRQITAAIAVGASLRPLLSNVACAAVRLCHSHMASIALLTEKGNELELVGVHGIRPPILGTRLRVKESFNGLVITAGRAVRCTDVLRDPGTVRILASMTGARGVLAVPLRDESRPFGVLSVAKLVSWRFSAHHEDLLTQLADSASIAIQNARLREQLQKAAAQAPKAPERSPAAHSSLGHDPHHLSLREHQILDLLAAGMTCGEAAATLDISCRTVEHYL
jgi:GAF domain-containing protein